MTYLTKSFWPTEDDWVISWAKYIKHEKKIYINLKKDFDNPSHADNAKPTSTSERSDIRTNMLLTSYKLQTERKNTIWTPNQAYLPLSTKIKLSFKQFSWKEWWNLLRAIMPSNGIKSIFQMWDDYSLILIYLLCLLCVSKTTQFFLGTMIFFKHYLLILSNLGFTVILVRLSQTFGGNTVNL